MVLRTTTAGRGRNAVQRAAQLAAAALAVALLGACSVDVRDPAAPAPVSNSAAPATPTITPGHDADAVAAQDMPFSAGGVLAPGVPVGIGDSLAEVPGWKLAKANVAGESQYAKADGCVAAAKVRTDQGPLVRQDDRDSTVALFQYLDPTILPEYLKPGSLQWGGDNDAPPKSVEVLVLTEAAAVGGRATAVLARLFGTAGSSIYVSVSCPDAGSLAAARSEVERFLPVLPPAN